MSAEGKGREADLREFFVCVKTDVADLPRPSTSSTSGMDVADVAEMDSTWAIDSFELFSWFAFALLAGFTVG